MNTRRDDETQEPLKRAVWDLPTRIFHWGLALSVFLSMFIVYNKKYLLLHITAGSLSFGLIAGRLVWGFVGSKYVRFGAFIKGFDEAKKEFAAFSGKSAHTVGHPAVAGWVMALLIFCALSTGVSGFWVLSLADKDSKELALSVHEIFANSALAIAFIHIQGVFLHALLHKDAIVFGMIDGKRPAYESESIKPLTLFQKIVAVLWFSASAIGATLVFYYFFRGH